MKFRFEDLEIWNDSISLSDNLFNVADILENYSRRFAEQLRGACLSISNNIAEGSGSFHDKEFANFLNIARRSVFECANLIIILHRRNKIDTTMKESLFKDLDKLARKITNFRKALL
jgi:four helix bundle protein